MKPKRRRIPQRDWIEHIKRLSEKELEKLKEGTLRIQKLREQEFLKTQGNEIKNHIR